MSSAGQKIRKGGIKVLKIFGWVTLTLVILLIAVAMIIQIPAVQQRVIQRVAAFAEQTIGTPVGLGHFNLIFPEQIVLEDVYVEDQSGDTLLYVGKVAVNANLAALLRNKISLNEVVVENLKANVTRAADSAFNFDYIIEAFSGDTTATDTTQAGWEFTMDEVDLNSINVFFADSLEGTAAGFQVGSLAVDMEEFDLEKPVFKVNDILLANVNAKVIQSQTATDTQAGTSDEENETASTPYTIAVNNVELKNIEALYEHHGYGQRVKLDLGHAEVEAEKIDIPARQIALREFRLAETFISYHQLNTTKIVGRGGSTAPQDSVSGGNDWKFSLDRLSLDGNSFQYYDFTSPSGDSATVNFDRLWLTGLSMLADDIMINGSEMRADVNRFSVAEKSGFAIKKFNGSFELAEQRLSIDDLDIQTPNSRLHLTLQSRFESLGRLGDTYPQATIDVSVYSSKLAWRDVLYFQPSLPAGLPLTIPRSAVANIHLTASGKVDDLSIDRIALSSFSETTIAAHGNIAGLPDIDNVRLDMRLDTLYTSAQDITTVLPDTLLPGNMQLPSWISIRGGVAGTLSSSQAELAVFTSLGSAFIDGSFNTGDVPEYNATLAINQFDIGALLGQPETIGSLTLEASVDGAGTSIENIEARLDAVVSSFGYEGYTYKDFHVDGKMEKYLFSGTAGMHDPNLDFTFEGDIDYEKDAPAYQFVFDLDNADLKALNLSPTPLQVKGKLEVDLEDAALDNLNGTLDVRNVAIFNGEKIYRVDSLLFASINQERRTEVTINSDIIDGYFKGTVNLGSLPEELARYFNSYYTLHDTTRSERTQPQNFSFRLDIKNSDLISDILVPELELFVPGEIRGEFDSEKRDLDVSVHIPKIQYANVLGEDIRFALTSTRDELNYELTTGVLQAGPLRVPSLEIQGEVEQDSINTHLIVFDSLSNEKYILGGLFRSVEDAYRFHFDPSRVILNYETWQVPEGNYVQFGSAGIWTQQMTLTHGEEQISVQTRADGDSTLTVSIDRLNLQNIVSMLSAKDTLVSGTVNGIVQMFPTGETLAPEADLQIQNLAIRQRVWGDMNITMQRVQEQRYDVNLTVEGGGNDMRVHGYLIAGDTAMPLRIKANIASFDMAALEPLTFGEAREMSGLVTGGLTVDGTVADPVIRGRLMFQDATFTASYLNTRLAIRDETIFFTDTGIEFDDFTVRDANNNPIVISGNIATRQYDQFRFNLSLSADDFLVLNTTEEINDLFYGTLRINATASIQGTSELPVVNMRVDLSDETVLTYVVPPDEAGVTQYEGIVRFVDRDASEDPFLASIRKELTNEDTMNVFTGIDLTTNIQIDDEETFHIVIDPVTGDRLTVRGNATLTLDIDPSGDMQLAGRYELTEGTYNFTFYKLVKRNFSIQAGSSITWTGDPYDALLDIRAVYKVETSPIELVTNQLTGVSQEEMNRYKQRLPFFVYMNIEGKLLSPEIGFEIDMPASQQSAMNGVVYTRIQEINTRESELSKQVFALLILRRFISDDPFENRAGESFESTARRSVSKFLTEQLNRLSENIEGIELEFDVKSYEDYATGEAEGTTQLQLGVSKNLFNERLVVKLSGNVNLEGPQASQDDVSDYIGDLALEYKLTEDGRLRLTGFRRSDYSMIDGELIETGAGLIYIKDYNTLSELFKSNAGN